MSSSKEDGAAAATQQFGSMSLGEKSVGKKDNETEPTKNGTTPAKMCSACETKSDALMKCRACKCVWYCDKKCQNKHWKEHKKECKQIKKELDKRGGKLDVGTELDIGPLEKMPPREECPICMRALPLHECLHSYFSCCGKVVCCGCDHQHQMKSTERVTTCAFCRTAAPRSDEELLARYRKRVERKDLQTLNNLAMHYGDGDLGLPVDQAKCIDLMGQAAALGFPGAQYQLGNYYDDGEMGLERNEAEALKYWKKAAEGGDLDARHNLGGTEFRSDNHLAAMRHWRLSASGGSRRSVTNLIICFEDGLLQHKDLAETLQAMYCARAELMSEDRDQWINHLKEIGKHNDDYEC